MKTKKGSGGGVLCGRDWKHIRRQVVRQEGHADFDQGTQETAPCQQFTLIRVICPLWAKDWSHSLSDGGTTVCTVASPHMHRTSDVAFEDD